MQKKLKMIITLMVTMILVFAFGMVSNAAEWKQDENGWWYQEEDGSWPLNEWKWIDGKCYYFNTKGYILMNTHTPDGYYVDSTGAWIVNGVIQTQENTIVNNENVKSFNYKDVNVTVSLPVKVHKYIGYDGSMTINDIQLQFMDFSYKNEYCIKVYLNATIDSSENKKEIKQVTGNMRILTEDGIILDDRMILFHGKIGETCTSDASLYIPMRSGNYRIEFYDD